MFDESDVDDDEDDDDEDDAELLTASRLKSELNNICRKLQCRNASIASCSKKQPQLNAKFFNPIQQERNRNNPHVCVTYFKPFGSIARSLVGLAAVGSHAYEHAKDLTLSQNAKDMAYQNAVDAHKQMQLDAHNLEIAKKSWAQGLESNRRHFLGTAHPEQWQTITKNAEEKYQQSMHDYEHKRRVYNNMKKGK